MLKLKKYTAWYWLVSIAAIALLSPKVVLGNALPGREDPNSSPPFQINDGFIRFMSDRTKCFVNTIDFGNVSLEAETVTRNPILMNLGEESTTIKKVSLISDTNVFSLEPIPNNLVLKSKTSRNLAITFKPNSKSRSTARIQIHSDALHPVITIFLEGRGQTANSSASPNNLDILTCRGDLLLELLNNK